MPGRKITGREAIVQGIFSRTLQRGIERKYGGRAQFLVADWDGNNDRYFADKYFGVGARHILVEFKSDLDDVAFELPKKPLRRLLCGRFIAEPDKKALADSCHYVGWGSEQPNTGNISVFLSIYSKICGRELRRLHSHDDLVSNAQVHSAFVSKFLNGNAGANNFAFVAYLRFLLSLAEEHYGRSGMVDKMDLKITWVSEQNGDFVENHISEFGTFAQVADKIERDLNPPEESDEDTLDHGNDSSHRPKFF